MEKNIVETVTGRNGEVKKIADYIGVSSFADTVEDIYREYLEGYDDHLTAEEFADYFCDAA